jgi:hypothetical protein
MQHEPAREHMGRHPRPQLEPALAAHCVGDKTLVSGVS